MKTFYDLSEEERVDLTNRAIIEKRTLHERWAALRSIEADPWSNRAIVAAELLLGEASIVDLGCGTMTLQRFLSPESKYVGVDVVARDAQTIVCDFNKNEFPSVSASAAACLGLIEYIIEVPVFMHLLSKRFKTSVISYCVYSVEDSLFTRRSHAWVNDFTLGEIEEIFVREGWMIELSQDVDKIQKIWRLKSKNYV